RFPNLADRDDLWRLLLVITERKAVDLMNHELRAKRGGGKVRNEASLASSLSVSPALDRFAHREPTPELAAVLAEECRRLLDGLKDATVPAVRAAKMEGNKNDETADRLEVALPTVERKLQRIRRIWDKEKPQ